MFNVTTILLFIVCRIFFFFAYICFGFCGCLLCDAICDFVTVHSTKFFSLPQAIGFLQTWYKSCWIWWTNLVGKCGLCFCLLCAKIWEVKEEEAAISHFHKTGHEDKERNHKLLNCVIFCTFITKSAVRLKLQTVTPYLRYFFSKLIPFCNVNKVFSYKVSYWTKKILFHHVIRKLLLVFPVSRMA